jgi:uncharacterized protein
MKSKKPRATKVVKPARRTARRAARKPARVPRRKPSLAKVKVAKRKTRTPAKPKTVRKRIIRKARKRPAAVPPPGKRPLLPIVAAVAAEEPGDLPVPQAELPAEREAEQPQKASTQTVSGLKIPPVLLEGDEFSSPPLTGPGQKYALGPTPSASHPEPEAAALPEAYGTGRLLLTARDPHWLYAHWDLTPEQQRHYNSLSVDHHLVLRVHSGTAPEQAARDVHVHPESRHWFVHVERGGTQHVAELGYYRPRHRWVTIAKSSPTRTPVATASADQTVRFATIPVHVPLTRLTALAKEGLPGRPSTAGAAQEHALAELVSRQLGPQEWASSEQLPELVGGRGEQEVSAAAAGLPAPIGGEAWSVTSPAAPEEQRPPGFWLNVNAELVIYGGTEPGAAVTVGGRPITLSPDGTFSCRYWLPDGEHAVTVSALSALGELRQADLQFSRRTAYRGEVASAAQDPTLPPPAGAQP